MSPDEHAEGTADRVRLRLAHQVVRATRCALQEFEPQASAPALLDRVALPLVKALQQFEREGFKAFAARYAARDLLRGRAVRTTLRDVPGGTAEGVSDDGALLVRTAAGVQRITSGEVSVRLNPPPEAP